jgi:2-phosphoglycerate kinase
MANSYLQQLLSHAYILGGSPCSGKSTIAEMLSARYDLQYYKADDHESEHMQRSRSDQQPAMYRYSKMSWDRIWSQAPEKLFSDELAFYRERFPLILDDLKQLDADEPVILEGAALLPKLIRDHPVNPENAVFMSPLLNSSCIITASGRGYRPFWINVMNHIKLLLIG